MKPILEIERVSKSFKILHAGAPYLNFRERIAGVFKRSDEKEEEFWALKDVSFNLFAGESLGIIGKNGAGKSTLLKILSRITPPTKGRIISRGRTASLLEVGTGFHFELTGRENVFMNGSILGMKKKEIKARFDEIVEFAGVEKFLDTPLKHYSSGMQLRLAFSVAAFLEPEILIIDEVLAVGDSAFQKKCIDKITEVSRSGRTVLFVSHNMAALKTLCQRAILLKDGSLLKDGATAAIVDDYLMEDFNSANLEKELLDVARTQGKRELLFKSITFDKDGYDIGDDIRIKIQLTSQQRDSFKDLLFGINFYDNVGNCVMHLSNIFVNKVNIGYMSNNEYQFDIARINLKPGKYTVSLFLRANEEIQDWISSVAVLYIRESNIYHFENSSMIQGMVQPDFNFSVIENE